MESATQDWLTPGLTRKLRRKGQVLNKAYNKQGKLSIVFIKGEPVFIETNVSEKITDIDEEYVAKR